MNTEHCADEDIHLGQLLFPQGKTVTPGEIRTQDTLYSGHLLSMYEYVCVRTTLCNSVDSSPGPCNVVTTVGVD